MDAVFVREWCIKAVTRLNVVEAGLELRLDPDQIMCRLAEVKKMVGDLLLEAHKEAPESARTTGA